MLGIFIQEMLISGFEVILRPLAHSIKNESCGINSMIHKRMER